MPSSATAPPARAAGSLVLGGDLRVTRLGFGTMRLPGPGVWGPPRDHDEAVRVLRRAVELGIEFLDTADAYGPYVAEELIREALHPYPDHLVIATKAGLTRWGPITHGGPEQWPPVGRPEYLRQEAEMSLRRLGLERLDLFQLHRIDPKVAFDDQIGELRRLQDEGKVRHVGLSAVGVDQLEAARRIVEIVSVQNLFNLTDRSAHQVLGYAEREGLAFIPYRPLSTGGLADADGVLGRISVAHQATPQQVALAWMLRRSPALLPIPGTSSVDHLDENVRGAGLQPSVDELHDLDALVAEVDA